MTKIKDSKIDFSEPNIYTGIIKPNPFTSAQLNAIPNPQEGWLAEDSDSNELKRYNGAAWTAISWRAADTLVGPGWDFDTVADALTAGAQHIAVVGATTETQQPVCPTGAVDFIIDFYDEWICPFQFDATNAASLTLNGQYGAQVTFQLGSANDCIKMSSGTPLWMNNMYVQNLSVASCPFPNGSLGNKVYNNIVYEFADDNQPFTCGGAGSSCSNIAITSIGGPSPAGPFFNINNFAFGQGIYLEGDIATGGNPFIVGSFAKVSDVYWDNSSAAIGPRTFTAQIYGSLSNARFDCTTGSGVFLNLEILGNYATIKDVSIVGVGDIVWNNYNNVLIQNLRNFGTNNVWTIDGNDVEIFNCNIDTGILINGERVMIKDNNLALTNNVSFQTVTGGATSKNCMVTNNLVQKVTADSGTNNNFSNNLVIV